jgi:transmembrane sensor
MQTEKKNIIKRFFEGDFSYPIQTKFRWWLLSSGTQQENEAAMKDIWENLSGDVSQSTLEELQMVKSRMEPNKKRSPTILLRAVASVVVIFVLSAAIYFVVRNHFYKEASAQEFVQVSVPEGTIRQITLADGSIVTIDAGSSIVYPTKFTSNSRKIFLIGKARFSVSKDAGRPFIVETQNLAVTALGTEFDFTNYPDEQQASTTLLNGKTRVNLNNNKGESIERNYLLKPNQKLTYDKNTNKVSITQVNASNELAWTTGNLNFDGVSLGVVLNRLQHRFAVKFICSDAMQRRGSYTLQVRKDDTLEQTLNILSQLNDSFTWTRKGDVVEIFPSVK